MNILFENLILARNDDTGFEWVVPVIVIVIWIIGGIGKAIGAAREERKRREKFKSAPGQPEKKMRYKPIPDTSAPQRRERAVPQEVPVERVRETRRAEPKRAGAMASLKKAMQDAMEEAYAQQAKRQAPKPKPRKPKRVQRQVKRKAPKPAPKPVEEPVVVAETASREGSVLKELLERENIRKAIIYSEILGKPMALREN